MREIAAIDWVFIVLALIFIIRSGLKGFISEFTGMASVILGILTALFLYKNGGIYLRQRFMPNIRIIPEILAFLAIFLIVFVLVRIVGFLLRDISERINFHSVDHFLGVILGIVQGLTVIILLLLVLTRQPLFDAGPILEKSIFGDFILPLIAEKVKDV
ncbi:MAG: CvpA family protein [Treponema sp.]|jgi:membrane protein required for colicin V production|nr:CvpA family protein [Treponema sp.]